LEKGKKRGKKKELCAIRTREDVGWIRNEISGGLTEDWKKAHTGSRKREAGNILIEKAK